MCFVLPLLIYCLHAAHAASSFFSNSVYVPSTETLIGSPQAFDSVPSSTPFNATEHAHLLMQFDRDVVAKFARDNDSRVAGAKRSSLSCAQLSARENLTTLDIDWNGQVMIAHKTSYQSFPQFNNRHVFVGALAGIDLQGVALTGYATVTWNDVCDPDVFHLSVTMNTINNTVHVLKSVPCSAETGIPKCTWLAQIQTKSKDEMESDNPARRLYRQEMTATTNLTINSTTTRKETVSTSVVVRDDGSVVKVLWFYTPASQAVWGDSKIRSMIAAGVVTANQALAQSKTGLRLQCVGMFLTENYNVNNHQQTLDDLNNGRVPGVNRKRDTYKADLVQMVIEDGQWCGLGNLMTDYSPSFEKFAFSTVYSQCFSTYSHLHEIAHNMGCQHNVASSGGPNRWEYGFGYRYCDTAGAYRTIMSYSCAGSTRVLFFFKSDSKFPRQTDRKRSCV